MKILPVFTLSLIFLTVEAMAWGNSSRQRSPIRPKVQNYRIFKPVVRPKPAPKPVARPKPAPKPVVQEPVIQQPVPQPAPVQDIYVDFNLYDLESVVRYHYFLDAYGDISCNDTTQMHGSSGRTKLSNAVSAYFQNLILEKAGAPNSSYAFSSFCMSNPIGTRIPIKGCILGIEVEGKLVNAPVEILEDRFCR